MKLIGQGMLYQFSVTHVDSQKWLSNWINDVRANKWKTTHDIKSRYSTASFLADNIVIFNVRGNKYRLETQIAYKTGIVAVKWIGTHAQYTRRYRKK